MNGLRHIQVGEPQAGATETAFPVRLVQAGCSDPAPGSQLVPVGGNSSCPELWDHAQNLFNAACKERDGRKHHALLMEAGQAFGAVVLATGDFPIEKSFALNNIGLIMQALDKMQLAEQSFAHALTMNPKHATILQNFATTRMIKGDLKDANEWFYKALEKDPECAEARWNSALISLTFGDFRRGFINYEWRWKCGTFTWRPLKTSRPQWKGQNLKGKTILLTHEQGLGDSIQFIRYAKMVKATGAAKVRFLCVPELICVLKDVEGIDSVTEFADINKDGTAGDEDFDYHCPLLSLPRIFKTRVESVPWDGPYVFPFGIPDEFQTDPQTRGRGEKLRVGIVWAGSKAHANDKNRSMPIYSLASLFDVPGVNWYSLQFGDRAEDADRFPIIYCPPLKTFVDTAWWLNELDLLISVDTAVVHLAGAMGRPVWTLLPSSSDWRWMMDRSDTPWYSSMKLFRQKTKGDWSEVISQVKNKLMERVNQ